MKQNKSAKKAKGGMWHSVYEIEVTFSCEIERRLKDTDSNIDTKGLSFLLLSEQIYFRNEAGFLSFF